MGRSARWSTIDVDVDRRQPGPRSLLRRVGRRRGAHDENGLGVFFKSSTNINGACSVLSTKRQSRTRKLSILINVMRARNHDRATTLLSKLAVLPLHRIRCQRRALTRFSVSKTLTQRPSVLLISRLTRDGIPSSERPGH